MITALSPLKLHFLPFFTVKKELYKFSVRFRVGVTIFKSPTVGKYIENGAKLVATIRRKNYYKTGKPVTVKVGDKTFYGKVVMTAPIDLLTLSRYVGYSGFRSVDEWLEEAERLHKAGINSEKFEIVVIEIFR